MNLSLKKLTFSLAVAMAAVVAVPAMASDHLDAPALQGTGSGQVDINDLYIFQSPENVDNSVIILTVNPGAGALSPTDFGTVADGISYQIQVDNTGDAVADVTYQATFAGAGAAQTINLTRNGAVQASGLTGSALNISDPNGITTGRVSTGVFEDPFFFDLNGFNNGLQFTGDDFFAGLDVSAIVLEVPNSDLLGDSSTEIGVFATTVQDGSQVDRVGRPAINTVLISGEDENGESLKDLFNIGDPENDFADFGDGVQAVIQTLNGDDEATAAAQTEFLLPDVLTFDTALVSGFTNGRLLTDDVINAELQLLTGNPDASDGVLANDVAFLDVFPFLAASNASAIPEPSSLLPLAIAGLSIVGRRRRR